MPRSINLRVGALLSCDSFESFFGSQFGLSREDYVENYRNDWSWEYAANLAGHGIDWSIYIPSDLHSSVTKAASGVIVRWLHLSRLILPFRLWPALRRTPIGRWIYEVCFGFCLLRELKRAIFEDRIDVLYVQEYWTGRFDFLVLALSGDLPVVGADHGGRAKRQVRLLKRLTFRKAALLTSQTPIEVSMVKSSGGRPILLPNAVDTAFFSPLPRAVQSKSILHVARLVDSHKRTSLVIRSLQHLPADIKLDIVGDGPDGVTLRHLVKTLGLGERVHFWGFVADRNRLLKFYRSSFALVQPSSNEARLLVALEAMSCGTPCILSHIPAFEDIVDDGVDGLLVEADEVAIAAAVRVALAQGSTMGEAARARILAESSWDQRGKELASLLLATSV